MQVLKLSKETISVLKNFNTINPSIYFRRGKVISTISPGKTIFAKYECPESFENDFGLYRLDKLLSVLSFFDEPELEIENKSLSVKANGQAARLTFADPAVLVYPQKNKIDLPTIDAEFKITEEQINAITKAYSVMELPYVAFESDGETLSLKALDIKNPTGDSYTISLAKNPDHNVSKSFMAIFNINNLKLIPADYLVKVSRMGIASFVNEKMTYWIAVEKDSSFSATR